MVFDHRRSKVRHFALAGVFLASIIVGYGATHLLVAPDARFGRDEQPGVTRITKPVRPPLDKAAYDAKMLSLAHLSPTTTLSTTTPRAWPPHVAYPLGNAILPFKRIVAFYGNFLSRQMGVLGEYDRPIMLEKLRAEIAAWEAADPSTPVIPAVDYIAITAQASAGRDGMYRLRMPDEEIETALDIAREVQGIVFLEMQVGKSTFPKELPLLEKYLKLPEVHLAMDPEFAMKKSAPGTVIGYVTAADVNAVAEYLAKLVRTHDLPPKVLLVHRFTKDMVRDARAIRPLPEVQVVIVMDGWGTPENKTLTYEKVIYEEPVQFAGFKLFYKNDLFAPSPRMMTPAEILKLTPQPVFIQYQ